MELVCLAVWLLALKLEKPVSEFPLQPRLGVFGVDHPAART